MTPAECKVQREQADRMLSAYQNLEEARYKLALVNRHIKAGQHWDLTLTLERSYARGVTIQVRLPVAIVQQQAIDAVHAAARAVRLLGGTP